MSSIENVKFAVMKRFGRSILNVKKMSPELLTGIGIAGVVATGVLLVRAGMKTNDVVQNIQDNVASVEFVHQEAKSQGIRTPEFNKDMTYVYLKGAKDLAKLYGPPVLLGVASIGAIAGGHNILRKRNVAFAAAVKAVETSFDEYRQRVREEIGEDKEKAISSGVKKVEVIDEKGKKRVEHIPVREGHSPYATRFDGNSGNWDTIPTQNVIFLKAQESYWNQRLHAFGHVFLNEIYDALDLPRTKLGTQVGWVIGGEGDEYISFGLENLLELGHPISRRFHEGVDKFYWLDFNVDGLIYDYL